MKSIRGRNPNFDNFDDGPGDEWDDYGPRPNMGNFRNERYSNAYGDYRGGYGPMNSGGFGPMNGGGFGPMNSGNFGPPRNMGPPPGNFGPRPLFPPEEMQMFMGRGFGPQGPPNRFRKNKDKATRYLIRCGVPNEHLKNLPRALLQLIEPQYCGLCAQEFNSFAISRTHYVSKNHLKNQKKWLLQQSEGGLQAREIPFKSRELYCELCDVHITSKSHADSHYAGKPHRAIVEGRKMPRNPALLQRSMSNRLEQLIRREKKNLKPLEDAELKEEQAKETKTVQSELYCDICKTSVTCTEQMTMHLNGKRHLQKEKQHILKMMKGDTNDNKDNTKEGGEEDDENEEEGDEGETDKKDDGENGDEEGDEVEAVEGGDAEAGAGGGEDDFDWGNGSGTWDEPETIQ